MSPDHGLGTGETQASERHPDGGDGADSERSYLPDDAVPAAASDSDRFAELYRAHVGPVFRYVCSRVRGVEDAEDLTAQVFTDALAAQHAYLERGAFAAWLFTIARRRLADHFRRTQAGLPVVSMSPDEASEPNMLRGIVVGEELHHLQRIVLSLSDGDQELLRLRFAAELTYGEMAVVLGKREGAVKMAVHRLLRRIARQWDDCDEP